MSELPLFAVAGANGFIGHRLVEWLTLFNAARVRPLVRSFAGLARLARFDLDCRVVDACNQEALAGHLVGCDTLFHCVVGDRDTILKSVESAYRACAKAEVRRLVYLSSAVVHGNMPEPGTTDASELVDDQPFEYNVSKVMAERRLDNLLVDGQVEVVKLRPCIVYGPRSKWWTAQLAEDMLKGRAYLLDGGTGICNTVYIDNLVEALYKAALTEGIAYQDYLITDGERVTWWDLYNSVAEALGIGLNRVTMLDSEPLALKAAAEEAAAARAKALAQKATPPGVPGRLVQAVKLLLGRAPATQETGWVAPVTPEEGGAEKKEGEPTGPRPDWETASLQCCQVVLPIDKARKELGYTPSLTFAEGARLTGEWLRFAYGLA